MDFVVLAGLAVLPFAPLAPLAPFARALAAATALRATGKRPDFAALGKRELIVVLRNALRNVLL
jgi:hypothetical protein